MTPPAIQNAYPNVPVPLGSDPDIWSGDPSAPYRVLHGVSRGIPRILQGVRRNLHGPATTAGTSDQPTPSISASRSIGRIGVDTDASRNEAETPRAPGAWPQPPQHWEICLVIEPRVASSFHRVV
jgi:hypothetical protein